MLRAFASACICLKVLPPDMRPLTAFAGAMDTRLGFKVDWPPNPCYVTKAPDWVKHDESGIICHQVWPNPAYVTSRDRDAPMESASSLQDVTCTTNPAHLGRLFICQTNYAAEVEGGSWAEMSQAWSWDTVLKCQRKSSMYQSHNGQRAFKQSFGDAKIWKYVKYQDWIHI